MPPFLTDGITSTDISKGLVTQSLGAKKGDNPRKITPVESVEVLDVWTILNAEC